MERYFTNGNLDFNNMYNDLVNMYWALCDVEDEDAYISGLVEIIGDAVDAVRQAV